MSFWPPVALPLPTRTRVGQLCVCPDCSYFLEIRHDHRAGQCKAGSAVKEFYLQIFEFIDDEVTHQVKESRQNDPRSTLVNMHENVVANEKGMLLLCK